MKPFLCFLILFTFHEAKARNLPWDDLDWDTIIFSQQWPITSCISYKAINPHHQCNLYPNVTTWTIHGLWPTETGSFGPNNCNKTWPFNMTQIQDLKPFLVKYWTNLYADKPMDDFWKHEWTKHGTCAAELPSLDSEHKYFKKALQWVISYNLVAVLAKQEIVPDDSKLYTHDEIEFALMDTFGVKPKIDCIYNYKEKRHDLSQIKLCFDTSLRLVHCSKKKRYNTLEENGSCPVEKITYPATVQLDGYLWSYSKQLTADIKKQWYESQSLCISWLCHAIMTVYSLIWITL